MTRQRQFSAIWAQDSKGVIGADNTLLWRLGDDMKFFQAYTMNHIVVMGRKTYESIPEKFRPLKGRVCIVISRTNNYPGTIAARSFVDACEIAKNLPGHMDVIFAGGGEVYKHAMDYGLDNILVTNVHVDVLQDVTDRIKDSNTIVRAPDISFEDYGHSTSEDMMIYRNDTNEFSATVEMYYKL